MSAAEGQERKLLAKRSASKSSLEQFKKQVFKQSELEQEDAREHHVRAMEEVGAKSLLFEPYRAIGYYTSGIPFSLYKSDQDVLLASSVGDHAFYVYNTAKLNLIYMSRFIEQKIVHIEAATDGHIYTALDNRTIVKWNKMNKMIEYIGHTKPIVKFILSSEFIFSLA